MAPARPCTFGGGVCPEFAESGRSRCAKHHAQQNRDTYDRRRKSSPTIVRFYGSAAWKKARTAQLAEHPTCAICRGLAVEVDHIVPLSEGGARFAPNLRSVCRHCHTQITAAAIERRSRAGRKAAL